uniref:Uncharacterized protein n=1 Tax=Romanomermis culicivorax TaxID=13658 RepID=A0A915JR04_ROMCU
MQELCGKPNQISSKPRKVFGCAAIRLHIQCMTVLKLGVLDNSDDILPGNYPSKVFGLEQLIFVTHGKRFNDRDVFTNFRQIDRIQRNLYNTDLIMFTESIEIKYRKNDCLSGCFVVRNLEKTRLKNNLFFGKSFSRYFKNESFIEDGIQRFTLDFCLKFFLFVGAALLILDSLGKESNWNNRKEAAQAELR